MNIRLPNAIMHALVLLLFASLVTSCNEKPPEPKQQAVSTAKKPRLPHTKPIIAVETKPLPQRYAAYDYIKSLALLSNETNAKLLPAQIAVIQGFTEQSADNAITQPVIVIHYGKKNSKKILQIAVPFKALVEDYEFSDLTGVITSLITTKHEIVDIRPVTIMGHTPRSLQLSESNATLDNIKTRDEFAFLLEDAKSFSDIEEANIQLHLLQFFIAQRIRDAAYLASENTKHSLANAAQEKGNADLIKSYLSQLDFYEKQLNEVMPFTINSL